MEGVLVTAASVFGSEPHQGRGQWFTPLCLHIIGAQRKLFSLCVCVCVCVCMFPFKKYFFSEIKLVFKKEKQGGG